MNSIKNRYDNPDRINALLAYNIMDTEEEQEFNELVNLASKMLNMPVSLISLLDSQRQWFKAKVGLDLVETPVGIAFCRYAIEEEQVFEIADMYSDERFRNNPLVKVNGDAGDIRFYAGTQLTTPEGYNVGTLCVMDTKPGTLTDYQKEALTILGKQVVKHFELRKTLHQLNLSYKKIEEQHEQLTELYKFKEKVFAIISHDLRAPIANVEQILALYRTGAITADEFEQFVNTLEKQTKDTSAILDNLLNWSGNHRPELVKSDVFELIQAVKTTLQNDARRKQIELTLSPLGNDRMARLDREGLKIVLRNLIKNSIKFCNTGGRIRISALLADKEWLFTVADNGVGFDEATRLKLFDDQQHITTYGTANEKGTGLGLLVCKNIVEQNGGRIWAEGRPGEGATFYFTIPA